MSASSSPFKAHSPYVHPTLLLIMLVMMSMGPIVSTDIFLPALPQIAIDLKVSETRIQWFIPIFLLSLGLSQPFYGPISDALGRRKILLFGIFLWMLTNILLFFTHNFHLWLALRFCQGVGACACVTLSRAIVSDLYEKENVVTVFLILGPCIIIAPALAPIIGQMLFTHLGWHSIFIFITLFGLVLWFMLFFFLPESLPSLYRRPFRLSIFFRFAWQVMRIEKFWYYATVLCCAYSVIFTYLTESPFLLMNQGFPKDKIGFTYIPVAICFIIGNMLARSCLNFLRISYDAVIHVGFFVLLFGGLFFSYSLWFYPSSYTLSLMGMGFIVIGNGCLMPIALTCCVMTCSEFSGSASGILGLTQLGCAALASSLVGVIALHQPSLTGIYLAGIISTGFVLYSLWRLKFMLSTLNKPT